MKIETMILYRIFRTCILIFATSICIDCTCQFPAELRGYDWYTTSNDKITIPADGGSIGNFRSKIRTGQLFTLTCDEYANSTDRYISTTLFTVFETDFKAFFCMRFVMLSSTKFLMYYDADLETTTQTRLVVINNVTGTLTPSQACALTSTQPTGTQEVWIRADSVSSSVVSCPSFLQQNLSATMQTSDCNANSIYGALDTTKHTYVYSSCVTSTYSSTNIYSCVYSFEEGAYTYVNVISNDTTVNEDTSYRFMCYVLWNSQNVVYFTYHPKICQTSQTPLVTGSDEGVAVVASYTLGNDRGSQIAVGVVFGLMMLALLIFTIIMLVLYIIGPRRHKAVKVVEEKQDKKATKSKTKPSSHVKSEKSKVENKAALVMNGEGMEDQNVEVHTRKSKKKHKKKKKKKDKIDENQNVEVYTLRRTESMKQKEKEKELKWTGYTGINSGITGYNIPEWQSKWEHHQDPLWGKSLTSEEDSETYRNTDSPLSTNKIVWVIPDKEEQQKASSLWDKVYRLWYEPRKPVSENKLFEIQKLANLSRPKHVRFKHNAAKSKKQENEES